MVTVYAYSVGVCVMEDDLIEDSGFELGMPSHLELLKHHCDLLCAELETTRRDLRRAHQNIAGLIVMYRESSTELAALKVENERLKWTLTDMYSREREQGKTQLGYAYGDYSPKKSPSSRSTERRDGKVPIESIDSGITSKRTGYGRET
jgi:hypothetical protein